MVQTIYKIYYKNKVKKKSNNLVPLNVVRIKCNFVFIQTEMFKTNYLKNLNKIIKYMFIKITSYGILIPKK